MTLPKIAFVLFHLPIQALIAFFCFRISENHAHRITFYTRLSGLVLAAFAVMDYLQGVLSDFVHLRTVDAFFKTAYLNDLLLSYLLMNLLYRLANNQPEQFSLLYDCIGPLIIYIFIVTAQESWVTTSFRPLLIGVVPNVIAAYWEREDQPYNPNLQLWFRVILPGYSLRYLWATTYEWNGIFLWILYNGVAALMEIRNRGAL
jgi:hypothetical protein